MNPTLEHLTFGVEIELMMPRGMTHENLAVLLNAQPGVIANREMYNHATRETWKVITDGSLNDYVRGAEVVSPVLRGQAGLDVTAQVCRALVAAGCTVNRSCGLHVHVGVRGAEHDNIGFFKRLMRTYGKFEPVIDTIVAPSRRGEANSYCRSLRGFAAQGRRFELASNVRELLAVYGRTRYIKLNLESYWRHGTVEFRQHQGSVHAAKVTNWVLLCLGLVAAAAKPANVGRIARIAPNPKRRGTMAWDRYALYREGMTMAEARAAGLTAGDLRCDIEHGWVEFSGADEEPTLDLDGLLKLLAVDDDLINFFKARQAALTPEALSMIEGSEVAV